MKTKIDKRLAKLEEEIFTMNHKTYENKLNIKEINNEIKDYRTNLL